MSKEEVMKKISLSLMAIILLIPALVFADPFLVCDPQTGVTSYILTGPEWVPTSVIAQSDGSIKMDVAAASNGSNPLTVSACNDDPIWGQVCSDAVPFDLIRPVPPSTPENIKLIQ